MALNDEYNPIAKGTLEYNGKPVFVIGDQHGDSTPLPGFYPHNGIFFVDCPGIEDTDMMKEYPK